MDAICCKSGESSIKYANNNKEYLRVCILDKQSMDRPSDVAASTFIPFECPGMHMRANVSMT